MSSELSILALYGLVVVIIILLHILTAVGQVGVATLVGPRDDMPKLTGGAGRLERATGNALFAMALFAPAILLLQVKGAFTGGTLLAAQIFLIARVLHPILYWLGIPWLRTLAWLAGFLATAWLFLLAV